MPVPPFIPEVAFGSEANVPAKNLISKIDSLSAIELPNFANKTLASSSRVVVAGKDSGDKLQGNVLCPPVHVFIWLQEWAVAKESSETFP